MLITAGPTYEPIDPVRFLGNRSSGKMGYALAEAALRRGAKVILVSGPTALQPPSRGRDRSSSRQRSRCATAVLDRWEQASFIIMAAAVADFTPSKSPSEKIKRKGAMELELDPNPDILADLGSLRHAHRQGLPMLIGFAAETKTWWRTPAPNSQAKRVDAIVVNDVSRPGLGLRLRAQRSDHRHSDRCRRSPRVQQAGNSAEDS